MPAVVQSSTEGSQSGGDTLTVNVPSGTVAGDLLLFFIIGRDPNALQTINTPAGLAVVWQTDLALNFMSGGCFSRIASGEPASYSWTIGAGGNARGYGVGVRIAGFDAGNVINVQASNTEGVGGTGIAPDVTTTSPTLLFRWWSVGGSQQELGLNPSGHTEVEIGEGGVTLVVAGLLSFETVNPPAEAQGTQAIANPTARTRINASVAVGFAEAALSAGGSFAQYSNVNFTQSPYHVYKQNKFLSEEFRRFRLGPG